MKHNLLNYLALTLLVMMTKVGYGQNLSNQVYQSPLIIQDEIEYFLEQQHYDSPYPVTFELKNINRTLKLKNCTGNLHTQFASRKKNVAKPLIKVSCAKPRWSITLAVRVYLYKDVLTLKQATPKNTLLQITEVQISKQDVSLLTKGYFENYQQIKQFQLKRALAANTILTPHHFKKNIMVKVGQVITIENNSPLLRVKMTGKALNNGGYGDIVKVRNLSSGKIIQATVIQNGVVKVFQ
jgi:flagella basal body P-ring formation protein FlgA